MPEPEKRNQSVSTPPIIPPPKKIPLPLIITVIIIFFASIFGGIALGKLLYGPQAVAPIPTLTPKPTPLPTAIPTVSSEAAQTANWKTYTDENIQIQFEYPSSWYAQKYTDETFNVFLEDEPFQIIKGTEFMTSIQIHLNEAQNTVTGQKFIVEKTLKEGVERLKENFDPKTVQVNELTIDGKKAMKISGLFGPGMFEGKYFIETLIQLDDKLLNVALTNKNYVDVYNQILSTFKFLYTTPTPPATYTACGCGCCGGTTPKEQCLYKLRGDDLNKIIEGDQKAKNSPQCATVGCSRGITYKYCD